MDTFDRTKMKFTNFSIDNILSSAFGSKCHAKTLDDNSIIEEMQIKFESATDATDMFQRRHTCKVKEKRTNMRKKIPTDSPSKSSVQLPAWVFCTRYSDRPSAGPRSRRQMKKATSPSENRHRTSFSRQQLDKLSEAFDTCPYLTDFTKDKLSKLLDLEESQIKIWFQNKRAKSKRELGRKSMLALELTEQGLYNHSANEQNSPSR